ncbi:MAG TPA: ATP-dependent DNA ligase [Solirubrobacterales bacterium]|nr:ATP-dependent DNA ligase [Solirubrobacterales bacterium]
MNLEALPVPVSVKPMLGRLVRELPEGDFLFEPKWDGFRCLAFRAGSEVDLRSRHGRPLARYFPEVVEAVRSLDPDALVLDGELVLADPARDDFGVLMSRLHPAASRVELLRAESPAAMIAFDLLAVEAGDLMPREFRERRAALERALGAEGSVEITPLTTDHEVARGWLERPPRAGVDGLMAKDPAAPYRPGARAMVKVKLERTLDCVVGGFRVFEDMALASLLLALYDERGELEHIGVASSFSEGQRGELVADLAPHVTQLAGHPWEHGFLTGGAPMGRLPGAAGRWTPDMALDWIPTRPELACEVTFDHLDGRRLRHPARFRRWRPDREPRSCTFAQIEPR